MSLLRICIVLFFIAASSAVAGESGAMDLFVSTNGDDAGDGRDPAKPLRTIGRAWDIASANSEIACRILLLPGTFPLDESRNNSFGGQKRKPGKALRVEAANGPDTVKILGGLNLANCDNLEISNLTLLAGGKNPACTDNVLHLENCRNVILKGLALAGPGPGGNIQEVLKINQCGSLLIEKCDISGSFQAGVDLFAVRNVRVLGNRIHNAGEWGMYVKGGSAYLRMEANEIYNCGLGFQAGEGSTFEVMEPPFIHYECYDVKFVNNILRDIRGTGIGVAGGYNVLLAYNTLYKVATDSGNGYPFLRLAFGTRSCFEASENGEDNAEKNSRGYLRMGGWGPARLEESLEMIPNRNVFVFNNIFCNPAPLKTLYAPFDCAATAEPPKGSNIPSPARADANLRIEGNLLINGETSAELGIGQAEGGGEALLRKTNSVLSERPLFANPARGDFHPLQTFPTVKIPDFSWNDAPASPRVPEGDVRNAITRDSSGTERTGCDSPGAFARTKSSAD
ncbi:MAG: right-handed parallel beta-helix repeat-containing protein [Victivallales bacterium]